MNPWIEIRSGSDSDLPRLRPAFDFLDGSWLPFGLSAVVPMLWFAAKVMVFMLAYVWFRGTFPRYRFDQLMALGWKWMLPLALANVILTGIGKLAL